MNSMTLSQIWIYPIKSLPGISLDSAEIEVRGLQHDRRWMLVDQNNHFITQRDYPQMSLIEVGLEQFGIKVKAAEMPVLIIPWVDQEIETFDEVEVKVWNDTCQALHINSAIDNWFSEALGIDCQLVYMPDKTQREVDAEFTQRTEITSFTDGFPNLLISEASLADLNGRLETPLSMSRFRPNLVVEGCEAFDEDTWRHFEIAGVDFYAVKACSRCAITTVDPEQGKITSKEPLKTLAQYRRKGNKVYFGQNVLHRLPVGSQTIRVGDSITVSETGKSYL